MDETGEKPTPKPTDQLIADRGGSRTQVLGKLAEKIQANFAPEKQEELFSPETNRKLRDWVTSAPDKANSTFREVYHALKGFKSANSPGHDFAHLVDNLNAAQRITQQYPGMSEAERLEVFTACLFHDLGRFAETFFEKSTLDKKKLGVLLPAFVGRAFERKIGKFPREFGLRVLFDIGTGSEPKTEQLTAGVVHQCDREQLIGSATIFRGLAFDVGIAKRDLAIPNLEDLKHKLPMPESPNDRYWLIQYEFLMRNLYAPVSPDGESVANANKQENAVILMLALEGQGQELFDQVFGPELGLVEQGDEGVHWSKKPIPKEVFKEAKREERVFGILKELGC